MIQRADQFSETSSSSSEGEEVDNSASRVVSSLGDTTEIRDDIVNRVVRGLNRERRDCLKLSVDDLNQRIE